MIAARGTDCHPEVIYLLSVVLLVGILVVSDLVLVELLAYNADLRLQWADKLLVKLRSRRGSRHQEENTELKTDKW